MAIDFSCSSCQKSYCVKDELAGKMAKCSACSAKMRIPQLVAASESGINLNDLIDDELPTEASATLTPAVTTKCRECGAALSIDAVVCVVCGFDKRLGEVLETDSEKQIEEGEKRTTSDFLKRGGAFSFLGAMLAAAIWLGLAILLKIGVDVGYPAILVGVLAGLGMSRGYGKAPGMIAGLVASLMAMAGIFAAKGLIFDHLRRASATAGKQADALEDVATNVLPGSELTIFNIYDVLFILVAMIAAYGLARGDHALEVDTDAV